MENILPKYIFNAIRNLINKNLNELRLRVNSPIMINVAGKLKYLCKYGICENEGDSIICRKEDIEEIVMRVSKNSLYSINDQLIKGYITYSGGIRIGVGGEFVYDKDKVKTIKNIQSLNIRIPHEVNGFSYRYFQYLCNKNGIYNTLILSPAGAGKTTFIRDFAKQLLREKRLNMLIVDEREEITGISNGESRFKGFNCDILSKCDKTYAFNNGIRSLRPDVIITDELAPNDIAGVMNAISSGVKVVATIHADNIMDLKNKENFSYILQNRMFDRYVLLGRNNSIGELLGVYNAELECIGL